MTEMSLEITPSAAEPLAPKKGLSNRALYILFMLQGIGLLFPWNTLLCAGGYYGSRLAELPAAVTIIPLFAIIFMTVKLGFLIFSSFIFHLISPEQQVIFSGVGNTIVFVGLTLMPLSTSMSLDSFFGVTLMLVFFASLFSAFSNNGLYTILGRYSPSMIQALSNGQGLAGILASGIKIICIVATSSTDMSSMEIVLTYTASTVIIGICAALFVIYHERPDKAPSTSDVKIVSDGPADIIVAAQPINSTFADKLAHVVTLFKDYCRVFSEIYFYAISVFLVLCLTLAVFPSFFFVTAPLNGSDSYRQLWPFIHIFLFNLGDWVGKSLPLIKALAINNPVFMFVLSILRFVHIPFYLFGNVYVSTSLWKGMSSDAFFYFESVILGVLNGYLATLSMMYGPSAVRNEEDRPKAGTVMIFSLTLGLAVGAYISMGIQSSIIGS